MLLGDVTLLNQHLTESLGIVRGAHTNDAPLVEEDPPRQLNALTGENASTPLPSQLLEGLNNLSVHGYLRFIELEPDTVSLGGLGGGHNP